MFPNNNPFHNQENSSFQFGTQPNMNQSTHSQPTLIPKRNFRAHPEERGDHAHETLQQIVRAFLVKAKSYHHPKKLTSGKTYYVTMDGYTVYCTDTHKPTPLDYTLAVPPHDTEFFVRHDERVALADDNPKSKEIISKAVASLLTDEILSHDPTDQAIYLASPEAAIRAIKWKKLYYIIGKTFRYYLQRLLPATDQFATQFVQLVYTHLQQYVNVVCASHTPAYADVRKEYTTILRLVKTGRLGVPDACDKDTECFHEEQNDDQKPAATQDTVSGNPTEGLTPQQAALYQLYNKRLDVSREIDKGLSQNFESLVQVMLPNSRKPDDEGRSGKRARKC